MADIALHIEYLLSKHDCVILPGWGAFLSQYVSSKVAESECLFRKPEKHIAFNPTVGHNDGLLVNSLIRKESISYDTAVKGINNYVASLKKQLNYDGTVSIGRIGSFCQQGVEGQLIFEPFNSANNTSDVYGLHDIQIKTIKQLTDITSKVEVEAEDVKKDGNVIYGVGKRFIQVAASVILLLGLTFVLSTPLAFDDSTDYAGLSNAITLKTPDKQIPLRTEGNLSIALPNQQEVAETPTQEEKVEEPVKQETPVQEKVVEKKKVQEITIPHNSNGNYYLIVSSLDSRAQANKFIASHSGDLRILECDGRYRIYAAQSNSYKTLKAVSAHLASQYPGAWILR